MLTARQPTQSGDSLMGPLQSFGLHGCESVLFGREIAEQLQGVCVCVCV